MKYKTQKQELKLANSTKTNVATKNDLEVLQIELKNELKNEFKKELSKYATKEELKELETRLIDQLASKESVSIIAAQVLKNSDNITALHKRVDELSDSLDNKFEAMMTLLDAIARDLKDGKTEKAAIDHSLNRHEQQIDNHEMRIDKLERKST